MRLLSAFLSRNRAILLTLLGFVLGAVVNHLMILSYLDDYSARSLHNLSLGICYDVMNAALLALVLLALQAIFFWRANLVIAILSLLSYQLFLFIDFSYFTQFGTHLPFSTIEYLGELTELGPTIGGMVISAPFLILLLLPSALFLFLLLKYGKARKQRTRRVDVAILVVAFIVMAGAFGVYPNSYVSKNLTDPLISSAAVFFHWSRNFEKEQPMEKPVEALKMIRERQPDNLPSGDRFNDFPLVRTVHPRSCREKTPLTQELCGSTRPNIIIILVESLRAVEIDSFGSQLGLTPNLERWKNRGIWFTHFFANGFQTRHGQVATYCSLMPNYGVPVMKRYTKNNFYCLPEQLKKIGYSTQCLFGTDAAFDNQIHFLPKIGFERVLDRFAFPSDTETLGWGYSDKAVFDKIIEILDHQREPFFLSALTITSHHPFEVPKNYRLYDERDDLHKYYESIHYADAMLGHFLNAIQSKPWYRNTLVFITADTANYQKPQSPYSGYDEFIRTRSQIPLLILGGRVKNALVEHRYFSQIDLAPTIMDIINTHYTAPWVGQSMLTKKINTLAFTNRPGNYWGVMSLAGQYYNESNTTDHYVNFKDNALKRQYKSIGLSWLKSINWLLQENRIWPD